MHKEMAKFGGPDDVVITGVSGIFPKSENVEEFKENLFAGKDMISKGNRRNMEGAIAGFIDNLDRFDNSFFRISRSQAQNMTYTSKMFLEKTFEAILDSGYNPQELRGKNIAVLGGVWVLSDLEDPALDRKPHTYNELFGRTSFMLTNRISNWLDIHGPGYSMDTACASSLFAMDNAIKAIQRGQCEGAIVCTANFVLAELAELELTPFLSPDGTSASFDASANGYVRAEAAAVVFLQKKKNARRVYANIVHSTTNSDGFKEEGFAFPSAPQQIKLFEQFYNEINMDPRKISYMEAHGTGTKVGDVVEGTSIDEFFCTNRETPLKIGTVKSNMGHAEAAGALCGIIKLIIAFETGIIPANLRFNNPNPKIKGLFNGHLEVISKPTPLEGEYFALNAFGIGGSNGHIVITPNKKIKKDNPPLERIPWLVTASGRTDEAVDCILNNVEKNHNDAEYIRLLHEIFKHDISGHTSRGYTIIQKNKPPKTSNQFFSGEKRPIWFVFSGMGSQWPAMGKSLLEIPLFAESIRRSHEILRSNNLDLIKIITEDDPKIFDNVLNSFVGIAAIQIALVDVLKILNVQPDGIIGHSAGELGCAYADGCLTAEQMILSAYYRGLVTIESNLIHGTMAAVGEGYDSMKDLIPPEIDIACHNGPTSCTLSGPTEIMQHFMQSLDEKKKFVRAINSTNIAFHSRHMAKAGPKLLYYLKKIIPEPNLRSKKWICSSAPEHDWDSDSVKYSSAEYHTNNLLHPVYFEETYSHIPDNAVTVEIAPHSLLNAILKRSLPNTVENIPLTMKNHENGVEYLLNAFGKMYEAGCDMELSRLYPPVEFPVSKSTPMISPIIKWKHEEQFKLDEVLANKMQSNERTFIVDPKSKDYNFVYGHIVDGRNLYPGFGYLWMVLETVASIQKKVITSFPVVFESVHLVQAVAIPKKADLNFHVSVHELNSYFEVKCNGMVVATGKVRVVENAQKEMMEVVPFKDEISNSNRLPLDNADFYKELRLRGYHYQGLFKSVQYVNIDGTYGEISWNNNFVTFMDAMAQIAALHIDSRDTIVPTFFKKVVIDFEKHFETLKSSDKDDPKFSVNYYPHFGLAHSGGIQMGAWKGAEIIAQKNRSEPVLEKFHYTIYKSDEKLDLCTTIKICVQIVVKNTLSTRVKSYELIDQYSDPKEAAMSVAVVDALNCMPCVETNVNVLVNTVKLEESEAPDQITISNEKLPNDKSAVLIILSNVSHKTHLMESILDALKNDGFIITKENVSENIHFENLGFNVCFSRIINESEKIVLLNKITEPKTVKEVVRMQTGTYSWLPKIQNCFFDLEPEKGEQLVLYAEKDPTIGIIGFFNALTRGEKASALRCFFIIDNDAPPFSLDNPFYKSQFDKNLSENIYKHGEWGRYSHVPLESGMDMEVDCTLACCVLQERGNLSSLQWVQNSLDPSPVTNLVEKSLVHVYYSGLNFKEISLAVGRISQMELELLPHISKNLYQGYEFSGKDENGMRVMGIVSRKAISTVLEPISDATWKVPDNMTLEEAATIPMAYLTVIFAFFHKMTLKEGSSVLIHSGSGGVGQAAINICLHYKCNIFVTVGTPEKVEFIKKTFPQIPESHIGNSRDTTFEKMVMEHTKGRGVDVVLNSLIGEKLCASMRCVAKSGHFLEIGKYDIIKHKSLELGEFSKNITFCSVQIDELWGNDEQKSKCFHTYIQEILDQNIIKPLRRTVYLPNEVESAYRCLASGKNIGKLLIKIREEETDLNAKPTLISLKAKPQVFGHPDKSYIILGGMGGFGMELVDWLVRRGARNIVLSSRTGVKNGYQSYRIELWRSYGAKITISTADVTKESDVKSIIQMATSLGPVSGIFNLAAILKDDKFLKQTEDTFKLVCDPKVIATGHLDRLSRKMCPELEHFVIFSSATQFYGFEDQINYNFANSAVDRICELRKADNLPALALQWGAIGEVGIVSEITKNNLSINLAGFAQQKIESCLKSLNSLMVQFNPVVCSMLIAQKRNIKSDIVMEVANLLGIKDIKKISLTWTFPELGVDSILELEIKQILDAEFGIFLTPKDLRTMTFAKLYRMKDEKENPSKYNGKTASALHSFMTEDKWKESFVRIPFVSDKFQETLPIDKRPTVFVFPGAEGIALIMESLAKNLPTLQVLCFQYHSIEIETSNLLHSLSDHFSSIILKKLAPEQEFHLISYSVGSIIALEVIQRLEKQGRKGHIWFIDSSPKTVKMTAETKLDEETVYKDELGQTMLCVQILQLVLPELPPEEYSKAIENAPNWESKKKICSSILSRLTNNDILAPRIFDKLNVITKALKVYEVTANMLNSSCVLIRTVQNLFDFPLDDSYGLIENFKNPIEVHKIENTNHYSITANQKTAEIIMQSSVWNTSN